MNQKTFRAAALVVSVCALSLAAAAQQPQARTRRGGLDNLSLPSTAARAAAHSTGAGAAAWMTFAPEGAGFSISLPGMPEETQPVRGGMAAQFHSYRLAAGGLKYELGRMGQMPEQLVSQPYYVEKFFEGARQGITAALLAANQQIKFRLVSEHAISLDGYEGREYEFAAEGHRAVARLFLVERSIYAISVLGAKSDMTPDKANKFLESFALTQ
ncbi:MAG TPA: hypothetical protein VER76_05250 [Pyrinomonadaceae bacterium]|nr:hypothetical protein [Pyrinomonadaceae bacterium]